MKKTLKKLHGQRFPENEINGELLIEEDQGRRLACETAEILLIHSLFNPVEVENGNMIILKGGMANRFLNGSMRYSSDLDFDIDPPFSKEWTEEEYFTLQKEITGRLNNARKTLNRAGFENVSFKMVKTGGNGQGTMKFKAGMDSSIDEHHYHFATKVEISERQKDGLKALSAEFGDTEVVYSTRNMSKEGQDILKTSGVKFDGKPFIKAYTPLAQFMEKLSAVACSSRCAIRDIYDIAYLYDKYIKEDPKLNRALKAYASGAKWTEREKDGFAEKMNYETDLLLQAIQHKEIDAGNKHMNIEFTHYNYDTDEMGIWILNTIDEVQNWWQMAREEVFR